jgi:hypothetical protein
LQLQNKSGSGSGSGWVAMAVDEVFQGLSNGAKISEFGALLAELCYFCQCGKNGSGKNSGKKWQLKNNGGSGSGSGRVAVGFKRVFQGLSNGTKISEIKV